MTDLTFYDAVTPPIPAPKTDGVAFYVGGDTPHIWTYAEVIRQRARYRLPIYVRSNPAFASPIHDVSDAVRELQYLGAPEGCLVAWDSETSADPGYMLGVFQHLQLAGYTLIDYGSQSSLFGNDVPPGGYYWGADWTNRAKIIAGDAGTQYFSGRKYDLSVFRPGLPLWDTKTGGTAKTINWQEEMMQQLPTLQTGATGDAVKTIQGLCGARGWPVKIDGVFGPETANSVHLVQGHAGITQDGIVGPETWPALLGIG